MKQHTPGPWAILDRSENSRTLTHVTNGAHIVCTLGTTRTDGSPNHSANARLIASAPEMLDALRRIESSLEHEPEIYSDILSVARNAIAKAKGEA